MTIKMLKQNIVGLKDLRLNTEKYIEMVRKGRSFLVVRKSSPVFKMEPVDEWGDDGTWEKIVDFTLVKKEGLPAARVLAALGKMA
jgi:antitoxin (DNA-binding transcriptional repressor) of toxin-antitoxin stability system